MCGPKQPVVVRNASSIFCFYANTKTEIWPVANNVRSAIWMQRTRNEYQKGLICIFQVVITRAFVLAMLRRVFTVYSAIICILDVPLSENCFIIVTMYYVILTLRTIQKKYLSDNKSDNHT